MKFKTVFFGIILASLFALAGCGNFSVKLRDWREAILGKSGEVTENAKEKAGELKEKAGDLKDQLEETKTSVLNKVQDVKNAAKEVKEAAKEVDEALEALKKVTD